ncbi:MAG: TSUP family transporter [Aeromicrobium erythreum]
MEDPGTWLVALLTTAAFVAGWTDAVVGGGGLVQLPSLLLAFPQAAPVQLLATNKLASIAGTTTSSITYARRIRLDARTVAPLAVSALVGSAAGAVVASWIPRSAFDPVVLVALVLVGTYTVVRPELGHETQLRLEGRRHYLTAAGIGLVIGFYDGALGPGTGSFLVFALVGLLGYGFLEASGKAKIANLATNLAALAVFVPQGAVMWEVGLPMAAANVAGGYLGARTAVARGSRFVRVVFLVVVVAFTVRIGVDVVSRLG